MKQKVDAVSPGVTVSLSLVLEFFRDDSGQDLLEYALLAAFVGVAGMTALNVIGPTMSATYSSWIDPSVGAPKLWDPCYLTTTDPCAAGS